MNSNLLTFKEKEWAYDQWCNGRTQTEIAEALHCSVKTITRTLHGRPRIRPILKYPRENDNQFGFAVGDRITYHSFGDLRQSALVLSSVGYGVAIFGYSDIMDRVLTITALPERKEE